MILRRSPFTSCGVLKTVFPFILVCFSCHRCDSQYFEVRHTCRAPIIPHGHVVDDQFSYHTQFKAGEHAFTVCNEGYHLSTTNNTNVCQKNSKWAYSWPQCISIRCPSPLPIDYGDYTIKKTDVSSSSYAVLYHCFSGYVLVGNRMYKSATIIR
ncbi:complement receptor type 2-like [Saccoglossus kowalevskii]